MSSRPCPSAATKNYYTPPASFPALYPYLCSRIIQKSMPTTSENNKRIAKNTLLLYMRMIFLMLISLYTSRVVLNALGVENYGIYSVVGGVVAMFTVVSGSLSGAISRFITFELGKGDKYKLKRVFSTSVTIQMGMSLVFVIIAETAGLWFLNTMMNIPEDRMYAANWVLQFSIITFVVNLINVPYNATIIAHERMSAFAYISILEAVCKLSVALLISVSPIDKLIFYGILLMATSLLIRLTYGIYCKRNFEECTYNFTLDKPLLKKMTSFAGWNFFGSVCSMFNNQGVNMLMNIYFDVTVNAARGVAGQVNGAISQFINSFTMAVNPQITKSYASGDYDYMYKLICRSTKFSSFLMLLIAVPFVLEAQTVLEIWLKNPPEYAVIFAQLSIFTSIINYVWGNALLTGMMATGNIKKYVFVISACGFVVFPVTWICYALSLPPQSFYVAFIIVYCFILWVRLRFMKSILHHSIKRFVIDVYGRIIPIMALAFVIPLILRQSMTPGILRLVCVCLVSVPVTAALSYYLGMTTNEKLFIKEKVKSKITSKFKY